MAIVKGISLVTLQSLSRDLTFTTWHGVPIIKMRQPKMTIARAPAVQVGMRRFQVVSALFQRLRRSARDGYKYWVRGSYFTLRDQYFSRALKIFAAQGAAPRTAYKFTASLVDGQLIINTLWSTIKTTTDFGYGNTGYGTLPYGTPAAMQTADGYNAPLSYSVGFSRPFTPPKPTFALSPPRPVACKVPPPIDPIVSDDNPTGPQTQYGGALYSFYPHEKTRTSPARPTCAQARASAWALINTPTGYGVGSTNYFQIRQAASGSNPNYYYLYHIINYRFWFTTPAFLNAGNWHLLSSINITVSWPHATLNGTYKFRALISDAYVDFAPPQTYIKIPAPSNWAYEFPIWIKCLYYQPKTACPPPHENYTRGVRPETFDVSVLPEDPAHHVEIPALLDPPFDVHLHATPGHYEVLSGLIPLEVG